MNDDLITVGKAAELLGNSVQHVRFLIRRGQLPASKVGRDWMINQGSVADLRIKRATAPLIPRRKLGRRPATKTPSHLVRETSESFRQESVTIGGIGLPCQGEHAVAYEAIPDNINGRQLELQGDGTAGSFATFDTKTPAVDDRNQLNDLTAIEWLPETVSVWVQRGLGASHPDAQIERQHPAPFSFTDVGRLIRFFTKRNAVVLDPFVGVGSTLKACALNGRFGIGIELNPRYVELTHERLLCELPKNIVSTRSQRVIQGDARDILPELPENSIDFVVTSPPYGNILHKEDHKARQERIANGLDTKYGDDPRDLGNIHDYELFLAEVAKVLGQCSRVLRPRKYMAVVVSDYRHGSKYVKFHADLADSLEVYGFELRGITVLYQRHKRVFPYGYPFSFVPNIHHQYILVMQNAKK